MDRIHYGFGKEYLQNWGIQQALREVYQNFLDYGFYKETVTSKDGLTTVSITNNWIPESLDFLRIGRSNKNNPDAIGKHGEGLKMAFLIFERIGLKSKITTPKYNITPSFYHDKEIGKCFSFIYKKHGGLDREFTIEFQCPTEDFTKFKSSLITKEDVLFSNEYGDIVNKEAGQVYSGGLHVINCANMGKAYNIKPQYLPLDRDRSMPRAFDVNYYSSLMNEAYGKINIKDLSYSDTLYVSRIPNDVKERITPKIIGNSIEFTYKDENGDDKVLQNDSVKSSLKEDGFFTKVLHKLRTFIANKLGLYDLLVQFKEEHVHSSEALADFELILERVEK